jgi:hypothetical protein
MMAIHVRQNEENGMVLKAELRLVAGNADSRCGSKIVVEAPITRKESNTGGEVAVTRRIKDR